MAAIVALIGVTSAVAALAVLRKVQEHEDKVRAHGGKARLQDAARPLQNLRAPWSIRIA